MVIEFAGQRLPEKVIDAGEKGGERLAGAGRRGNQDINPRLNGRPSLNLNIGGLANPCVKPFGDERMKSSEGHGNGMLPQHWQVFYQARKEPELLVVVAG
jgi:hypothetical protein